MTPKQAKFVERYLVSLNATKAAIEAGYSKRTASSIGEENLRKPEIASAIAAEQSRLASLSEVKAEDWRRELRRVAFSDVRRIFTQGGGLLLPVDMDDDTAAAVQAIEVIERPTRNGDGEIEIEHVRKIKLNDKLRALELLGRHYGFFVDGPQAPIVNVNVAIVDRPPAETREQWLERTRREREALLIPHEQP